MISQFITIAVRGLCFLWGMALLGLAGRVLWIYWKRWDTGALPQHIALMAASYLLMVIESLVSIIQRIELASPMRWFTSPILFVAFVLGTSGLMRMMFFQRRARGKTRP